MDYDQQEYSFNTPDAVPAFLARVYPLDERYAVRIVKDQLGGLEIDPVLVEVPLVFLDIPLELNHLYVQISTYTVDSICSGTFDF